VTPPATLVTARSYLIDRHVPACEIIALPQQEVAGGQFSFGWVALPEPPDPWTTGSSVIVYFDADYNLILAGLARAILQYDSSFGAQDVCFSPSRLDVSVLSTMNWL